MCPKCGNENLINEITFHDSDRICPDEGELYCEQCGTIGNWQEGYGIDWDISEED